MIKRLKLVEWKLWFIVALAAVLRFYNYSNRWGLAADQARDVLVAHEALALHTLPLIGPFSASGPFVFGPYWYWIFMIPIGLFPHTILAPWIFQSLLYMIIVLIMYCIGKNLVNKNFGLLLAFFTAISNSEIKLSSNIIISGLIGFLSVCILFCFIKYIKETKLRYGTVLAFLIGIAINTHFEAVPLTLLLILAIWFGKRNIKHIATMIVSFLVPFLPLIIFDIASHGYETSNIFHLHQKSFGYGILIPILRKWFDFSTHFFPTIWANTIGGTFYVGVALIFLIIICLFFAIKKKKLPRELAILCGAFLCMIGAIGFYSGTGTLFQSLLSSTFSFMLIFSAWVCYCLYKKNKLVGIAAVLVISFFSIWQDIALIQTATNNASTTSVFWENKLTKLLPNERFTVYTYTSANEDKSMPLSLYLYVNGLSSDHGTPIGVAYFGAAVDHSVLIEGPNGPPQLRIYNLSGSTNSKLVKEGFIPVNPRAVYNSVEEWWK